MNEDPVDRLLSGLRTPAPPAALRDRVLSAARGAVRQAPDDPWTRLLKSRPVRLAWAASLLLLLGAHALVRPTPPRAAGSNVPSPRLDREIEALARLPRIDERALASRGASALEPGPVIKKGAAS